MTPVEHCPSCYSAVTFLGALGCQAPVRTCRHPFHCRNLRHRALAHMSELSAEELAEVLVLDR